MMLNFKGVLALVETLNGDDDGSKPLGISRLDDDRLYKSNRYDLLLLI